MTPELGGRFQTYHGHHMASIASMTGERRARARTSTRLRAVCGASRDVRPPRQLASRWAEAALGGVADGRLAHGYHQRDVGPNSPTQTVRESRSPSAPRCWIGADNTD